MAPKVLSASKALEDAVEGAKLVRKSPLTRARPRVPAKMRLTYLERRARASDPPPKATGARARRDIGDDVERLERVRRRRVAAGEVTMNWRKYWKKGVCTLLIVTASTTPRTRARTSRDPGPPGKMSSCLCRKQSAFNRTSTPKSIRLIFGRASSPCRVLHGAHKNAENLRGRSR